MSVGLAAAGTPATAIRSPGVRGYVSSNAPLQQPIPTPGASLGATPPQQWFRAMEFFMAFELGFDVAMEMVADDATEPPDAQVWERAIAAVSPFAGYVPVPLVMPLQLGGVSVEWHEHDIDLELRFRGDSPPFVVTHDLSGACAAFRGHDSNLVHAWQALACLAARSA